MQDELSSNEKILLSLVVSAIFVGLVIALMSYVSMPLVHMSNATQQCVKVDDKRYTCHNLPAKYQVIWVK